ncbi:hypothetical protein ACFE04_015915 [Oxalis oulophora]
MSRWTAYKIPEEREFSFFFSGQGMGRDWSKIISFVFELRNKSSSSFRHKGLKEDWASMYLLTHHNQQSYSTGLLKLGVIQGSRRLQSDIFVTAKNPPLELPGTMIKLLHVKLALSILKWPVKHCRCDLELPSRNNFTWT